VELKIGNKPQIAHISQMAELWVVGAVGPSFAGVETPYPLLLICEICGFKFEISANY